VRYGDTIIAIDDVDIKDNEDIVIFFDQNKAVGDPIEIRFIRDGKEYGTKAIVQEL
jgi:S1-C subfamily serine protease